MFVPLTCRSWFTLLEGVDSPEAMLECAAALGYRALGLTDHNTLGGVVRFADAAHAHGIHPVLGARLAYDGQAATALIAEPEGYRSLCRVLGRIHTTKPPSLLVLLAEHAAGLHLLLGDPALMKPPVTDAYRGRLWAEVVRPALAPVKERALLEAAQRAGARPVASLAPHFCDPAGFSTYRLVSAVRQGQKPDVRGVSANHHLAAPASAAERFKDLPEAVANTRRLADYCRGDVLPRGVVPLPAKVPAAQTPEGYLRLLCERGFGQRTWGDNSAARERLEAELALITGHGLTAYFLAVAEIAGQARRKGWPMAVRGSAGSSLACLLLGISDIDPLEHGIGLDRFVHTGRVDLPDIDLDFAAQELKSVFAFVLHRYSAAHVARVGAYHSFGARAALGKAAEAHGIPPAEARRLSHDEQPAGLDPERWASILADARLLEGRPHELGAHPSGIVLSEQPMEDQVPLQRWAKQATLAQFDKDGCERVGLAKIDLLSNRALSTQAEARAVAARIDPPGPPPEDDPAAISLLQRGDTLGISQLETPGVRRLLRAARPLGLSDLAAVLALARPAASCNREPYLLRKGGLEAADAPHPSLGRILAETQGVVAYEDDALAVVQALAGWSPAEAERLRRGDAAGYLAACDSRGVPREVAEWAAEQLRRFGERYGLCKAHAVSYATIAWNGAALKARHPLAFWVAALNHHEGNYERWVYVEAAKRAGLYVLPPCVNRSQMRFTQEVTGIRVGLSAVRGMSEEGPVRVLEDLARGGAYESLEQFRRRTQLPPSDVAQLVRAGAFDFAGVGRRVLLKDGLADQGVPLKSEPWPLEGWGAREELRDEWEVLGFQAGLSVMAAIRPQLPPDLADSRFLARGTTRLAGLVVRAGDEVTALADEFGLVEVEVAEAVEGLAVIAEGEVVFRHGVPVLTGAKLERPLAEPPGRYSGPATIPFVA